MVISPPEQLQCELIHNIYFIDNLMLSGKELSNLFLTHFNLNSNITVHSVVFYKTHFYLFGSLFM